jgi:hypothetical protein
MVEVRIVPVGWQWQAPLRQERGPVLVGNRVDTDREGRHVDPVRWAFVGKATRAADGREASGDVGVCGMRGARGSVGVVAVFDIQRS